MLKTTEESLVVYKENLKHYMNMDKDYQNGVYADLQTLNMIGSEITGMETVLGLTPEEVDIFKKELE